MTIWQAFLLGIVQGVGEFLPISSSGHLVVMQKLLGFDMQNPAFFTFDIVVHIGSLAAILLVFWPDIWALIKNPFSKMVGLLIVGTIPVVVAGFFLRGVIEVLRTGIWLAAAFTVTGFLLLAADKFTNTSKEEKDITYLDALIIGILQAMALPPGISRSGTTIAGALGRGINRAAAAKFSFLLAVIAIAGAGFLEAVQVLSGYGWQGYISFAPMAVGFTVSLVVGYFSIKLLLKLISSAKLKYFSYYVWILAGLIFIDVIITNRFF